MSLPHSGVLTFMAAWLKWLLQEIATIIGWDGVWDHWETLKQFRWGKKLIAIGGGLVLSAYGWVEGHPAVMWFALGMVAGGIITRLSTWFYERRRARYVDWDRFSFLLPIENAGLWLKNLATPEPFVGFKFRIANATGRHVDITGIKGIISINGPCNAAPRLSTHHRQRVELRPSVGAYEISIEQPVTRENADSIIETLKRQDRFVRFGFWDVELLGTVTLDTGETVALQRCYLDRTINGTFGQGIVVKGPIDVTDQQIGKPESCFVGLDAQGQPVSLGNGNAHSN
jgi:hypothetical protein